MIPLSAIISCLSSTVGRFLAVGAVAALAILGAYWKGYAERAEKCRIEAVASVERAIRERMERDARARVAAEHEAEQARRELGATIKDLQAKVTDYESAIAAAPDDPCRWTDDDLKRLYELREH